MVLCANVIKYKCKFYIKDKIILLLQIYFGKIFYITFLLFQNWDVGTQDKDKSYMQYSK